MMGTKAKTQAKPVNPAEMLGRWLAANRARYRTDADLAAAAGISGGRLSQILGGTARPGAPTAIAFHRITGGQVPGNVWRPDLWRSPADVPIDSGEAQ